jgi:hypothetical protein
MNASSKSYKKQPDTVLNMVSSRGPINKSEARIAVMTTDPINPYSVAVMPSSPRMILDKRFFAICLSPCSFDEA